MEFPQRINRDGVRGGEHRLMSFQSLDRREFVVGSTAAGATLLLPGSIAAAVDGKKTFTILHTNDLHSNLIGLGPASDYTSSPPSNLSDDKTRGGFARLATLIAATTGF
jgi:5'-nucleotidase/UDP-sugar diphosphatase